MITHDITVVGAGAAGLMAATAAAEAGARVLLLEKNRRPGVKILMSGGTRCNVTHDTDNRGIVAAYGKPGRFLHSALAALSVDETREYFEAEGCLLKVEETGKIFPVSNKALTVLQALLDRLGRTSAEVTYEEALTRLERSPDGFVLHTTKGVRGARRVILTTGGKSFPGSGTTGDGYGICEALGHTIVPPRPSLVPITVADRWPGELRGITLPDVGVDVLDGAKSLMKRRGSLLFAHFGLTGPVVLDVSREVSGHPSPTSLRLEIDLLPGVKEGDLEATIQRETAADGKKLLAAYLAQTIPRRVADVVLPAAGLALERRCAALSRDERRRLVVALKRLTLSVTGTLGFAKAEVTAGGVPLEEVDSRTCESRIVPGLYIAGELLDLDGPIGGYNFQAAWSTGTLAGRSAASS